MDTHTLVINFLFPALVVFTLLVAYVVAIRPILRQNPTLKTIYDYEETYLGALGSKFSGIKQKLMTVALSVAGLFVVAHDQVASLATAAGIDPMFLSTQLLPQVPSWVWPFVTMGVLWLVQYFRNLADKQAQANAIALLNAGQPLAAPAPGIPLSTPPSPSPVFYSPPDKPVS